MDDEPVTTPLDLLVSPLCIPGGVVHGCVALRIYTEACHGEPEPTLRGVVGRADADRLEEIWKRGGTVVMGPPSRIEVAYGP